MEIFLRWSYIFYIFCVNFVLVVIIVYFFPFHIWISFSQKSEYWWIWCWWCRWRTSWSVILPAGLFRYYTIWVFCCVCHIKTNDKGFSTDDLIPKVHTTYLEKTTITKICQLFSGIYFIWMKIIGWYIWRINIIFKKNIFNWNSL